MFLVFCVPQVVKRHNTCIDRSFWQLVSEFYFDSQIILVLITSSTETFTTCNIYNDKSNKVFLCKFHTPLAALMQSVTSTLASSQIVPSLACSVLVDLDLGELLSKILREFVASDRVLA